MTRGVDTRAALARAAVMKLLDDPRGFRTDGIEGFNLRETQGPIWWMGKEGVVFKARISHRNVRYFGKQEWADAFLAGLRIQGSSNLVIRKATTRAPWAADTPAHFPVDEAGRPAYKLTIAPPPPQPTRTGTFNQHG